MNRLLVILLAASFALTAVAAVAGAVAESNRTRPGAAWPAAGPGAASALGVTTRAGLAPRHAAMTGPDGALTDP